MSRTVTNKQEQNKEKESEKHRFNEVRQLPTSSEHKGRDLSNQSIQVTINGDNIPLYIGREPMKKKKNQRI